MEQVNHYRPAFLNCLTITTIVLGFEIGLLLTEQFFILKGFISVSLLWMAIIAREALKQSEKSQHKLSVLAVGSWPSIFLLLIGQSSFLKHIPAETPTPTSSLFLALFIAGGVTCWIYFIWRTPTE